MQAKRNRKGLSTFLMEPRGLEKTFQVLAHTRNPAAVGPLIRALDSPWPKVQLLALQALLNRREPEAPLAIIQRLGQWPEHLRQVVWEQRARLSSGLRDAIVSPDFELSLRALQAAVWLHEYDLAPILVNMLLSPATASGPLAADVLLQLAAELADELQAAKPGTPGSSLEYLHTQFLRSLTRAIEQFDLHKRTEVLIAGVLLADVNDPLWQRILDSPHHKAHRALAELLARSTRPEVIRLLLAFLEKPEVPPPILRILSRRRDPSFVTAFLDYLAQSPSPTLEKNLARLRSLSWLEDLEEILPRLTAEQQQRVVYLCNVCGIRRAQAQEVLRLALRDGHPLAKKAAVESVANVPGPWANALIRQAIQDPDPEVQAAAVRHLRPRGIVGALPRLIELLDSPHSAVQDAARESLQEFRFERFLAAFDLLDERVRHTTGQLVRKVDPTAIDRLRQELNSPVRGRRLRAIAMVEALQAFSQVEPELIALTQDPDHIVRTAAIRALGRCDSQPAREAVLAALNDQSVAVQLTAQSVLASKTERTSPSWTTSTVVTGMKPS